VSNFEFQSYNFPGLFIRHRNFQGFLTKKEGPMDDFSFALVRRGAQNRVALRSVNFQDRYLRHRNFRVWLEPPAGASDQLFQQDSTFIFEVGLADPEAVSFRSVNVSGGYLRHRNFELWVETPKDSADELFKKDATFYKKPAAVRID